MLTFSMPPLVAATVSADGTQALTPGHFTVRIGGVASGDFVEGSLTLLGEKPAVLFALGMEESSAKSASGSATPGLAQTGSRG